jgi:hypothetical protein
MFPPHSACSRTAQVLLPLPSPRCLWMPQFCKRHFCQRFFSGVCPALIGRRCHSPVQKKSHGCHARCTSKFPWTKTFVCGYVHLLGTHTRYIPLPSCCVCEALLTAKLLILLSSYTVHHQDTGCPLRQLFHDCTCPSPLHIEVYSKNAVRIISLSLPLAAPMPGNSPLPIYNPSLVPMAANSCCL